MLYEVVRNGRQTIVEDVDQGADPLYGYHIETVDSRRAWDKKWMAPTGDAALIREIQRTCPEWLPIIAGP